MAIFDIFKRKKQIELAESISEYPRKTQINVVQVGTSGTEIYSGYVQEDYLQELRGTDGMKKYDQMRRNDPKIKMCISAVINPIKSASWSVVPGDDTPESKRYSEFIEYCLFNAMNKTWKKALHEILTMITYGYSLFERVHQVVYDDQDWKTHIRLKNLFYRSQKTITAWNVDDKEQLLNVEQWAYGDSQKTVKIPAKYLSLFNLDSEGNNFEGISMLRPCYGAWKRKNMNLKLLAVGMEKYAINTPILKVPAGKESSEQYTRAVAIMQAYLAHQLNYITVPEGWEIDFLKSDFDAQKIIESVKHENNEMVNAFLANFLELGQGSSGSYALSYDLSDFFLGGIEHIADQICEVFNQQIIPELINLNFGKMKYYPQLKCSGISDKAGKELSEILKTFADANIIRPDDLLETHIRERYGLPEASEEGREDRKLQGTGQGGGFQFTEATPNDSTVKLAEKGRQQIESGAEEIKKIMASSLMTIGEKLVDDIMKFWKNATPAQRSKILGKVQAKKTNDYKKALDEIIKDLTVKGYNQAAKEVGVKLSEVKFAEFEDLPLEVRNSLLARIALVTDSQTKDLEKILLMQYQNSAMSTEDEMTIRKDLNDALKEIETKPIITTGSMSVASTVINTARIAAFFTDESMEKISAFQFYNPAPVAEICQNLAGRIVAKDDPDLFRMTPPLHWNCKSILIPILTKVNAKPDIDPRGLKPTSKAAADSITFADRVTFPDIENPKPGNLQSIVISKKIAKSVEQAKKLAKDFGAQHLDVEETDSSYRFRQRNPSDFVDGSFKTFQPEGKEGISLIYGRLK